MQRGNYGLDAPGVVIGYLAAGVVFEIAGIVLSPKLICASWLMNLGILFILIGLYMVYSSKVGKYKMRDKILKNLTIKGNETTLDVGCGRGLMLNGIASKLSSGTAYGIDIWSKKDQSGNTYDTVMKNAKLEGTESKIKVVNADMRKMPFEDGYFDIIVSSLAIHNLKSDADRKNALIEISRVAKEGCQIAILDLAHIDFYADILLSQGFTITDIRKHQFQMFPPTNILIAHK